MEEELKRIELYGGKHVFLEFVYDDDTSYIIRAYDSNEETREVVGCCYFDIEKLFQRKLSQEERLANAVYFGGIAKTPETSELFVTKKDLHKYNINDNILTFRTHGVDRQFPLKFAKCKLELIEIKRKDFFKTGLGTAMLNVMQSFAIANDCFEIYALFCPLGDFASGSRKFYVKNGFTFDYDPCDHKTYATKFLPKMTKTNIVTPAKTTGGKGN